jgi:GTP-binding protein HflX
MKPNFSESAPAQTLAIVVAIDFGEGDLEPRLAEAAELVAAAGARVAGTLTARRNKPDASFFAGSGKVEEIAAAVVESGATLVVFDHQLSPIQIRNIEKAVGARVIDRTDLILDIFARRARSAEGKLQVELAQMQHLMTRLVKGWTHLERQRGGIGVRGGPGETQLEIDRRLVGERIKRLKERLKRLERQRQTQRAGRKRSGIFTVSLVGYTNAGKSTLFNRMTGASAFVADQLFATLDTTTRRLFVAPALKMSLSDTVGFIRNLPHGLVAAFRATLTEAMDADLLLHVVDASNHARDQQIVDVNLVLEEIGAHHIPQLLVYNKIDRLPGHQLASVLRGEDGKIQELHVSAQTGAGIESLRAAIAEYGIAMSSLSITPLIDDSETGENLNSNSNDLRRRDAALFGAH